MLACAAVITASWRRAEGHHRHAEGGQEGHHRLLTEVRKGITASWRRAGRASPPGKTHVFSRPGIMMVTTTQIHAVRNNGYDNADPCGTQRGLRQRRSMRYVTMVTTTLVHAVRNDGYDNAGPCGTQRWLRQRRSMRYYRLLSPGSLEKKKKVFGNIQPLTSCNVTDLKVWADGRYTLVWSIYNGNAYVFLVFV